MKNVDCVARRNSRRLLIAALIAGAACGKAKDARSSEKPVQPRLGSDAPLTDVVVHDGRASTDAPAAEDLPAWTQEPPRFFDCGGRRCACAVGWAVGGDPALARAAAEDRARVDLFRFIKGGGENVLVGPLPGAHTTDVFNSSGGKVYVRVEVPAAP